MFKKALQIAVTFSLLVGGYAGYARVFGVVARQLGQARDSDGSVPFPEIEAKSAQRANELARESLGPDHWAARKKLNLVYYEAARGFFIYAEHYERLKEGKQLRIWPFALIWVSADGRSHKTATSNEAVIDMSQPFGLVKQGNEPSRIVHAQMIGDVRLRDDKGTRDDPTDDLRVGPLAQPLEYDEARLQITTASEVFLQDRDLTMTGLGMMIQLRRKVPTPGALPTPGGSGFDAESAYLYKDVHIVVKNVGPTGILPGTARPEKGGQTPLDLRADAEMKIDLPRPRPPVLIGPPDLNRPPDPTLVKFRTNVRVLRGTVTPDQLNSDTLDLTLMPNPRPPDAPAPADGQPATGSGGPLTDLKLRKALAKGHAVWLQSESQGIKARCSELRYLKQPDPSIPDETYLVGETSRKLWVEKVEYEARGPNSNAIKSILTLNALDAKIFDYGPGGTSKVVAQGPGKTEERPARNASVVRTAWWEDRMDLLTWREGPTPPPAGSGPATPAQDPPARGTLRRLVTLTGVSKLVDTSKEPTTLDARRSIVAEFETAPQSSPAPGDGGTRIKWLQGFEDVHLTAPGRTLTARKQLDAKFLPPALAQAPATPPAAPPTTGPTTTFLGPAPAPAVAANIPAPGPGEPGPGPEPPPAAPVQAVDARADRVWATILLGAGDKPNGELKDAQLRGGVMVHQDPAPGEAVGSDASGEALDLFGQGNGLMRYVVAAEQPQAANARAKLASNGGTRQAPPPVLARVDFKGRTIESEKLVGLDQKLDYAFAQGAGQYVQLADAGLLDDKGLAGDDRRVAAKPSGPGSAGTNPTQQRMTILWTEEMKFHGRSQDREGRAVAKAEFRGTSKEVRTPEGRREFHRGVAVKMDDAAIFCDTMDVYMDRTINLNKGARTTRADTPSPAEPDAQIASMECWGQDRLDRGKLAYAGVDITSQKLYPGGDILREKQRIQHTHVTYDKRTGEFEAPGPGIARLYKRKSGPATDGIARPVASPSGRGRGDGAIDPRRVPPLELTKITFTEGMRGRMGMAKEQVETERRVAYFLGNVQAANATVAQRNSDIDFDRPNAADYMFLTSDALNVYSYPPPPGSRPQAQPHQYLNALGNAGARTIDRLIQADRILFDSATDLVYAYGDDDKQVAMIEQKSPGQEPSTLRGRTGLYNKRTREGKVDDPQSIQFTDLASGVRPRPFFPDLGGSPKPFDPIKAQRMPFQRSPRNSTERKAFTGGT